MSTIDVTGLRLVEEADATDEVAALYAEIKQLMLVPEVPNFFKALAVSPAALAMKWASFKAMAQHQTLPQSLVAMISFAIAAQNDCEYCSAMHEVSCRTLGIDEGTLQTLLTDLPQLNPERIRAVLQFALKAARAPKTLTAEDYDALRAQGVSEEELVEIIVLAATASSTDVLADALKVEVDRAVVDALAAPAPPA
jgi:uncharacterized peroxidase-related enzyme